MVNWKDPNNLYRLVAVLIAANPSMKFDYHAMAVLFGQGATYDSIQWQLRGYKTLAGQLRAEAAEKGVDHFNPNTARGRAASTPKTPRGLRGGITKTATSSARKSKKSTSKVMGTPTKARSRKFAGDFKMEAILIDNDNEDIMDFKAEAKIESDIETILPSIERPDLDLADANTPNFMIGVIIPVKREDVTNNRPSTPTRSKPRSRRSPAPSKDVDGDEHMISCQGSPSVKRGCGRPRASRCVIASGTDSEYPETA
ncbi:hypothetical protein BDV12DRAFT_193078 [Aspergillus spectabilis]